MSFFTHHTWMSLYYTLHSTRFIDHLIGTETIGQSRGALRTIEFQPPSDRRQQGLLERAQTLESGQARVWLLALPFTRCDGSGDRSEPPLFICKAGVRKKKNMIRRLSHLRNCWCTKNLSESGTQYDLTNVTFSPVHLPFAKELHISSVSENVQ